MLSSDLLCRYQQELADATQTGKALDLACGNGRNGLYLLDQAIPVEFADRDSAALARIRRGIETENNSAKVALASFREVDLEGNIRTPLPREKYGAILVFRYLHRPLFPAIMRGLQPGGLLIYETFTVDQPQYGRPTNPDFLLRHGELAERFASWDILHSFEGISQPDSGSSPRAIAQIVARKPLISG